jgi:hypothetical protein
MAPARQVLAPICSDKIVPHKTYSVPELDQVRVKRGKKARGDFLQMATLLQKHRFCTPSATVKEEGLKRLRNSCRIMSMLRRKKRKGECCGGGLILEA